MKINPGNKKTCLLRNQKLENFRIFISFRRFFDKTVTFQLHVNFTDDQLPSKTLVTETMYILPRDLAYLFQALRLPTESKSLNSVNEAFIPKVEQVDRSIVLPTELKDVVVKSEAVVTSSDAAINKEEPKPEVIVSEAEVIPMPPEMDKESTTIDDPSNTDSGIHSM